MDPFCLFQNPLRGCQVRRRYVSTHLRLDDISIIVKLVTLEILSIRHSDIEELPVEIGNLTNLIMLEFRNRYKTLKRISAGVLSRLVQLEELHMLGVNLCSYFNLE